MNRWLPLLLLIPLSASAQDAVELKGLTQPRVALGPKGVVYVAGLEGGNIVVRAARKGLRFGAARVAIDAQGQARGGRRRGPRIGVSAKGELVVTAPVCFDPAERKRRYPRAELWLVRSQDGETWTKPLRVNARAKTASEALHEMVVAPDGTAHVAWLDHRRERTNELWYARVEQTVGRNQRLTGPVCECCAPGLAVDGRGGVLAIVRGRALADRPVWTVRAPKGKRFGKPVQVNGAATGIGG